MHHDDDDNEEEDGWGHWAMGNNVQQENEMEVDLDPNISFQGLLDSIHDEEMNVDNPPPNDSSSDITYSSRSFDLSFSDNSANHQLIIHDGPVLGILPNNPKHTMMKKKSRMDMLYLGLTISMLQDLAN
jgi:hypothetical protein